MKKKGLLIGIAIVIIAMGIGIGIYLFSGNDAKYKNDNMSSIEKETKSIKKDTSKDLIYLADYTLKGYEEAWYYSDNLQKECSLSDIQVPYININTEDAEEANKTLKALYDETANYFKKENDKMYSNQEGSYTGDLYSYKCSYKHYINCLCMSRV